MQLIGTRILIKQDEITTTKSGLYLTPTQGKHKPPFTGRVIKLGNSIIDTDYREGIKIAYRDLAGYEVELNQIKYLLIDESDILAIINE